ncbi:LysR family transcriptional regulator [uncultured Tistrella sp.]|uniref:LysR family transcriptional regulator n=1 Tax=Tistrella mobilis TaxID=171437 RepID=UPI0026202E53|nr:LysR family transcriptional regulator [uncultured Tistrella sp.]
MTLRQLRYLIAVVAAGSITGGARSLNVSQPALSAGLAALEDELGTPLLERQRGAVRLTALGRRFHRRALGIVRDADLARQEVRRGLEQSVLTLGVLPTVPMGLVLGLAEALHRHLPAVELTIREAREPRLAEAVGLGRMDAALTISDRAADGWWVPVRDDPLAVVCPPGHDFARRGSVRVADLDGEAFVLRMHCERGRDAQGLLDSRGIRLRPSFATDQDARAFAAVRAGLGVTIAPRTLVPEGLGFVAIEDLGLTRRLGLQLSVGLDERLSGALVAALRDAEAAQMAIPDANVSIN